MPDMYIEVKKLRAAMLAASTDRSRPYLNGIYVDPAGYLVASNGPFLFAAQIDRGEDNKDGWIISLDDVKAAMRGIGKTEEILVNRTRIGNHLYEPMDHEFPEWQGLIKSIYASDLSGEPSQFDPKYVAKLCRIAGCLRSKVPYIHHNGIAPCPVTFENRKDCFAVLMPLHIYNTRHRDAMAWALT